MEHLLEFLPSKPQPVLVRYGSAALLVLAAFAFRAGAGEIAGQYGFILFIPPILVGSVLFDRGTGYFATALSVALLCLLFDWQRPAREIAALTIFAVVALLVVAVSEGMRKALERSSDARKQLDVLLQEQGHRIKNDLTIASSLIALQARAQTDNSARTALESAVNRLHVLAKSHDHLRVKTGDQATDMQQYLSDVCWYLGEALRGARPIAIEVDAERVLAKTQTATQLGLIVNELVTNALKHAFPHDRAGTIFVQLRSLPDKLMLVVEDNGAGCTDHPKIGLGSRIVQLLVQQLGGEIDRDSAEPGCRVIVTLPPTGF